MERIRRNSMLLAVVFGVVGISSCRQHHNKEKADSKPWFPAQFTTPTDQSLFFLSHTKQNKNSSSSTKGLHTEQTIGILGNYPTTLQAAYGPFMVAENVTLPTNVSSSELNKFTVKTELLTTVLQIHDPTVRVLFRWEKEVDYSNGATDGTKAQEPLPCVKLIINYDERELSSACRMQGGVLACVVKLPIPVEWWSTMSETDSLKAYYSVFEVAENAPCLPDNQNAIPPRDGAPGQATASPEYYVGEIKMGSSYDAFTVNREDQYVWIHSPVAKFGSNAQFQIPVSILSNFTATGCVIRAKARQGLQVVAVHTVDNTLWSISSRVNPKGSLAMVTMLRKAATTASYNGHASTVDNADPQQEFDGLSIAFTVEFEVLNGTDGSRPINWRIDYEEEMHTMQVRTEVKVHPHNTQSLLSIIKDGNFVNTAVLNGIRVNKPMTVLATSYAGQVLDVTGQATCTSTDKSVVQVDTHCRHIYVDGSETSGSLSVQIQISYEGQTTSEFLSLWMPEFPLEIELNDDELSMIRGWKVPAKSMKRVTRGAEFPDLNGDEEKQSQSKRGKCQLKYQQTGVQVYTRFYAPHVNTVSGQTGKKLYLFGKHMRHRITGIVQDQLTTEDTSIASIKNGQLVPSGKSDGHVLVKVVAPYGTENLGDTLATVVLGKVTVEDLHVSMVTGMSMKIHPSQADRPDILRAKVKARDQIITPNQEIVLDGYITFTDGTSINLQNIRHKDFLFTITDLDPSILAESPHSTARHPTLIAVGEGISSVKLELKIPESCNKYKNNDVVAYDLLQINVSYSGGHHTPNGDNQDTKKNWRVSLTSSLGPIDYGSAIPGFDPKDHRGGSKGKGGKKGTGVISSIPIDIDINDLSPRYTNNKEDEDVFDNVDYDEKPDLNFINQDDGKITPLEIGMYVLLAVFCIAIFAFMINCILFMARYRRSKRVPGVGQSTYPQNWVLFGPDDHLPAPMGSPEEMMPLRHRPGEDAYVGSPEDCTCTESEVSVERHSNNDCGMHNSPGHGSEGTIPCNVRIYDAEMCDCCKGVCECEMDTAMHDGKSEVEDDDAESDRGSVSICSSESRENMKLQNNAAADCCNNENVEDNVGMHANPASDDCVDSNAAEFSIAIAPEEASTSTEATEDLEDPSGELRITLNPTEGTECSLDSPQDEVGFGELLDYLSELQESCA